MFANGGGQVFEGACSDPASGQLSLQDLDRMFRRMNIQVGRRSKHGRLGGQVDGQMGGQSGSHNGGQAGIPCMDGQRMIT